MSASPILKALLVELRQHPAFPELIRAVEKPRLPQFKASSGETSDQFGAKTIFLSGRHAQHEVWLAFLTGQASPLGDD